MKIEMGESLMQSWAKHVKKCQITALNWKCSKCWEYYNQQEIDVLIENMKSAFSENIFGNSKNTQIISQAELDVLGINIDNNTVKEIYAIDIAFHGNGLGYSNNHKKDNLRKITKKMLRSALVLYSVFNLKTGNIVFATPRVQPKDIEPLQNRSKEIEEFMKNAGFNFKFLFICNEDFYEQIVQPVQKISDKNSDTSELFMRSLGMIELFKGNHNKGPNTSSESQSVDTEPTDIPHTSTDAAFPKPNYTIHTRNTSDKLPKKYFFHGGECSEHEFEKHLRAMQPCNVIITIFYATKPSCQKIWEVSRITNSSNLVGNIHSKHYLRNWKEKQITGVKLEIK